MTEKRDKADSRVYDLAATTFATVGGPRFHLRAAPMLAKADRAYLFGRVGGIC